MAFLAKEAFADFGGLCKDTQLAALSYLQARACS